jgi:hypothetical protein
MEKIKTVIRKIKNPRYSRCSTAKLKDLDWEKGWWSDDSFEKHYIHVHHKDGETIHRVFCKEVEKPRIGMDNGEPIWLFTLGMNIDNPQPAVSKKDTPKQLVEIKKIRK